MKINDDIKSFPICFKGDNTFFADRGCDPYKQFDKIVSVLKCKGKTVLFTDKNCFKHPEQPGYKNKVKYLLKKLNARKILFCGPSKTDESFFNEIKTELSSIGCTLDFYHYIGQHDRWWINLEDKIALFGASINTIGVSKCTFIELKNDFKEAQDVIDDLIAEGVINGTEWNTGT